MSTVEAFAVYGTPFIVVVLTIVLVWYAYRTFRPVAEDKRMKQRAKRFREVRSWMRDRRVEIRIIEAAHRLHADLLAGTPMNLFIAHPSWVLAEPVDLDLVKVEVVDEAEFTRVPEECYAPLRRCWPARSDGKLVARYHEAIEEFDTRPAIWFNQISYRLLDVSRRSNGGFTLWVGTTTYFEGFDSWGGLQFEAAYQLRELEERRRAQKKADAGIDGPYRRSLGSPFTLANRDCAIGISVLAVHLTRSKGPFFYLQRRSGKVATMAGMAGLIPAGEFQPTSAAHKAVRADADIWRCVMREFAEEFLGRPDLVEQRGAMVDYEHESPFRELERARSRGEVRPYVLEIGFDPVTWKAGVRIVCIFDEDAHAELFRGMLPQVDEGDLEIPSLYRAGSEPLAGIPLDEEHVLEYLKDPTITEAARLCIGLTWEHREILGIS